MGKRDTKNHLARRGRNVCYYCRRSISLVEITVDHVTPLCRGGPDTMANVVFACRDCNARKGPLTEAEFMSVRHDDEECKKLRAQVLAALQDARSTSRDRPGKRRRDWCVRCQRGWHGACPHKCTCPEKDCFQGNSAVAL